MHERLNGFMEAMTGLFVGSLPFWAKTLDQIVVGAHALAVICGAVVGIHGVYRIFRGPRRIRATDIEEAGSDLA